MTPDEKGRFCQKCAKTVIDFSQLSDEELVTIISRQKGELCGRFLENQLSRPIVLLQKPSLYKRYSSGKMAAAFLLLQMFVSDARAQKKTAHTTQSTPKPVTGIITIKGVLLDFETQKPIVGRKVYLNNDSTKKLNTTTTDHKGNFSLKVSVAQLNGAFLSFDQNNLEHFIPDEKLTTSGSNIISLRLYQYLVVKMPVTTIRYVRPSDERMMIQGAVISEPGPSNFRKLNQLNLKKEKH
ncbi:carboxypeptidase-like regulatory domain-containing protein [Taibaiella soli]|uniref:Uncharacterized protein n=1 Tax=Taibaiella soli TaxID=1649169 RepID=A0A2W2AEK7_9BACT|nr:carboxypeptidase-like regulatory domain-containing protein [Taibaiella soli]PZF73721.1 hypothetical protein DN068_06915 [Taibaiella soli]